MVLEIKKLTFGYKKNNFIFENFDLELKKGELKTIFGKSGSGKTTLFELILGNLKQKSGEIKKSKTAMIFQDPFSSFHPTYTIFEQIKDVVNRDFKDEVDNILSKLSLEESLLNKKRLPRPAGEILERKFAVLSFSGSNQVQFMHIGPENNRTRRCQSSRLHFFYLL